MPLQISTHGKSKLQYCSGKISTVRAFRSHQRLIFLQSVSGPGMLVAGVNWGHQYLNFQDNQTEDEDISYVWRSTKQEVYVWGPPRKCLKDFPRSVLFRVRLRSALCLFQQPGRSSFRFTRLHDFKKNICGDPNSITSSATAAHVLQAGWYPTKCGLVFGCIIIHVIGQKFLICWDWEILTVEKWSSSTRTKFFAERNHA